MSDLSPSSTDVLSWSDQDGSQSKDGSQSSRGERLAQVKENYILFTWKKTMKHATIAPADSAMLLFETF